MSTIEELIDSAIEACEVSGDAMRWADHLPARTAPEEINMMKPPPDTSWVQTTNPEDDHGIWMTTSHEAAWRPGRVQVVATLAAVFFGALLGFVIAVVVL